MINANNRDKMQRRGQIIELSDHVKNKLKQHQYPLAQSSFVNSSDEFIEVNSIDDDNDSTCLTPLENTDRQRRDTFTTFEIKRSPDTFFTDRKLDYNSNSSILKEKHNKKHECEECIHRDRIINLQKQDLIRLYQQNKQLNYQLHSSILLNHQYENDIEKYKYHLKKVNSNLYEYQINFDHLKHKILSKKKNHSKLNDNEHKEKQEDEQNVDDDVTTDHIKRLHYEIQMYNRIVAAKEKQEEEKNQQKQIHFLF